MISVGHLISQSVSKSVGPSSQSVSQSTIQPFTSQSVNQSDSRVSHLVAMVVHFSASVPSMTDRLQVLNDIEVEGYRLRSGRQIPGSIQLLFR